MCGAHGAPKIMVMAKCIKKKREKEPIIRFLSANVFMSMFVYLHVFATSHETHECHICIHVRHVSPGYCWCVQRTQRKQETLVLLSSIMFFINVHLVHNTNITDVRLLFYHTCITCELYCPWCFSLFTFSLDTTFVCGSISVLFLFFVL